MKPGATTSPLTSTTVDASSASPIAVIARPSIPTSRTASRPDSGSMTRPPRSTTSWGTGDLYTLGVMADDAELDLIAEWLRAGSHVTALTGAGISTESGIPDFRGPNGLWTKNPDAEKAAQIEYYMNDPELRKRSWQNRLSSEMWHATPNAAHVALVELERRDALHALVTQNVDGLHHAAGQSPHIVT